jgi:subtilisin family serine protease
VSTPGARTYTDGRYVVLLREPSAAQYDGGNPRFAATRAQRGEQFRADNARVRAYSAHLRSTHASIARELGTSVSTDYTIASNGFAAHLTAEQALDLATDRRVLLVEKDALHHADTWNTPSFLGLTGKHGAWTTHGGQKKAGDGVVVADLDSGIWPESKSFAGSALTGTPKTKWDISRTGTSTRMEKIDGGVFHGECEVTADFTADNCNTKLIGARSYSEGYVGGGNEILPEDFVSPRDGNGHGTHTASTAAGDIVDNVKTEDVKFGTISGMAPAARIAAYKVLWAQPDGTASGVTSDIVAAIDDAVADGADVINFSISGAEDTIIDATELAFEGAAEAGVFVSTSAGNSGPTESTVAHNSPWEITVAASTHHNFENTLVLGNGRKIVGASISQHAVPSTKLVLSSDVALGDADATAARLCGPDTLDPAKVAGTIVVCIRGTYDRVAKSAEVKRAGGKAMVLANASEGSLDADFHSVPTIHIQDTETPKVLSYIAAKGAAATAAFKLGNITKTPTPLPQAAGFSSRGPAIANDSDLLKPDIAAPGVSVLAAVAPPSNEDRDYDLYSGTSMAAPHITGLGAFMLGVHPSWTPMMLKSAMMTTAKRLKDSEGKLSNDVFAEGAGQVRPKQFFDPGLFVVSNPREWLGFITGQGLNTGVPAISGTQVNLPSLAQGQVTSATSFTRTFTSSMKGTWKVAVHVPGFQATLSKPTVVSKRVGDQEELTIDFARTSAPLGQFVKGWVTLTGPTAVRMPVALRAVSVKAPAEVHGTGVTGSVEVPITAGFDGQLTVDPSGLAKADTTSTDVAVGDVFLDCVTVGEGSKAARFDVDAEDDTADLDLFVYAADNCDTTDSIFAVAGQSATGSADERVTLIDPEPGSYWVEVDGFAAGDLGGPMNFDFDFYDIGGTPDLGDFTVTPNPVPVLNQQETTFEASWTALDPNAKYLGMLEYEGALRPTFVGVTS